MSFSSNYSNKSWVEGLTDENFRFTGSFPFSYKNSCLQTEREMNRERDICYIIVYLYLRKPDQDFYLLRE